ncbi:N-acetyltransferase [Dendrosporobacter sp. 1207_IL3150]|uniref:N-acetyltransferase n=1 Tax=Dendrosporobacter sp. 1207_IL3150 TaxID=3084054 RepID=UPI002FDA3E12
MIKEFEMLDTKEVMDIWLDANIAAHSFIPQEYWIDNYKVVEETYLPSSQTFVYQQANTIKAFISIVNGSFIGALFVSPECQGKGIGKELINYCKSIYSTLELAVYSQNKSAVEFYKHCGFTIIAEQPNEDSGFNEYIMSWVKK